MTKIDSFTIRRCVKRLERELTLAKDTVSLFKIKSITDEQYEKMAQEASEKLEGGLAEARELAKCMFLEENCQTNLALEREKKRVMVGLATLLAAYADDFQMSPEAMAAFDLVVAETFDIYFTDMLKNSLLTLK